MIAVQVYQVGDQHKVLMLSLNVDVELYHCVSLLPLP